MTGDPRLDALAERLDAAASSGVATEQPSAQAQLSLDEAYTVQRMLVERRLTRGETYVGPKLGFTSRAKMLQMGVSDVIVGRLTDAAWIDEGGVLALDELIHPRIEPEVAFRLSRDVDPGDPTLDIEACVDAVAPAMEVIDSRYRDFRFSLADVVADNTSAARFVIGPWSRFEPGTDIANKGVLLEIDGDLVETGSTAAILGNPVRALHALVTMAGRYRLGLTAGAVVLAGSATAAVALTGPASIEAHVSGLGRVGVTAEGSPRG